MQMKSRMNSPGTLISSWMVSSAVVEPTRSWRDLFKSGNPEEKKSFVYQMLHKCGPARDEWQPSSLETSAFPRLPPLSVMDRTDQPWGRVLDHSPKIRWFVLFVYQIA